MSSLIALVQGYKDFMNPDLYTRLHEAVASLPEPLDPGIEAAVRTELHNACDAYMKTLKEISQEIYEERSSFLKAAELQEQQLSKVEVEELHIDIISES